MIELDAVNVIYTKLGRTLRALDGLSLAIGAGELVVVRGPSGSGKTTLLSVIGGMLSPTAGRVVVNGHELSRATPAQRAAARASDIGFVFQMFHLVPYLTVRQNVMLGLHGAPRERRSAPAAVLERVGLMHRLNHRVGELSAGEKQRAALARAIIKRPPVLLADEPTGNLDPANARGVCELIEAFRADGGTVVLTTHAATLPLTPSRELRVRDGRLETHAVAQHAAEVSA